MKIFLKDFIKHAHLLLLYTRRYLVSQMEYRGNFFTILIVESIILLSKLLYVNVIYSSGVSVNSMTPDAILMFTGTFFIISSIYGSLFMFNFFGFRGLVKDGGLDLYMTKPISLQFMSTMSTVDLAVPIPNIIAGIILVVRAWRSQGLGVDFITIAGYLGLLLCGVVMIYGILLFPQLLSFWFIKIDAINDIAVELSNFNIMPMFIYRKWMQRLGTFIIPMFVITNFPALFAFGKLNNLHVIWGIAAPIIVIALVRVFWSFSIKRYSSASN